MPRVVLTLAEWRSIARELAGTHHETAPPGLQERVQALLTQAPQRWLDQSFALELDEGSAEVVRTTHALLTKWPPGADQRQASLAEAAQIIRDHQRRQ